MTEIYEIAIIGSGAAGSMGCLRAVLNNLKTVCFAGNGNTKKKARATWVGKVENMPVLFDKPKAVFQSANEVFKWIKGQDLWRDNLTLVKDSAMEISGKQGDFKVTTGKGQAYHAKYILLCTGIMDVQPEIHGDISPIFPLANKGDIEYCIRCDGHKTKGREVAIIGHQESALWIASLLIERYDCPKMTVVTNGELLQVSEDSPVWERKKCYGIEVATSPIDEILGDPKKEGLTGIRLMDGELIDCQIAFVSLGTIVYNELAKSLGCEIDDRGYVVTDDYGETKVAGVFVGGDLRAGKKKQIYTAWDITVDAVDRIDNYVRKEKRESEHRSCRYHGEEKGGALMG